VHDGVDPQRAALSPSIGASSSTDGCASSVAGAGERSGASGFAAELRPKTSAHPSAIAIKILMRNLQVGSRASYGARWRSISFRAGGHDARSARTGAPVDPTVHEAGS
jgi:hypothetical protein